MQITDLIMFDQYVDRKPYVKEQVMLAAERLGLGIKETKIGIKIYVFSPSLNPGHNRWISHPVNTGESTLLVIRNDMYTMYTKVEHFILETTNTDTIMLTEPKEGHIYDLIDGDDNHFEEHAKNVIRQLEELEKQFEQKRIENACTVLDNILHPCPGPENT